MKTFFRTYRVLLLIVLVKLVLQFVLVNPVYELHRDEFLHLDQANHLALGFISLPPLTSLFARVIFLFGGSLFMVRLVPAIFGALTIVFAWLITEILGGRLSTRVVVALALLFSPLIRINILFQPNSFDILIWTILFYFFIKYIKTESNKWLYLVAVAASIAFYNKYMIAFLLVGLLAGILLTSWRKLFAGRNIWLAVIIGLVIISPNLLWQMKNHFPVIRHMQVLKENQLDNNTSLGFIISQVKIFSGSLPLTLAALAAFIFYKPFRPFRVIGICFVTVISLLTFMKGKDYYSLGLYPVILAFGAVYLESLFTRRWKSFVVPGLIIFNLIPFVFTLMIIYPVLSPEKIAKSSKYFNMIGALRWEDGKTHTLPQDFADMLGWKEMAAKALEAYNKIPLDERDKTLVFCYNYGETGALNYYNRGKMPLAYSFNTDYIFWLPRLPVIKNMLVVADEEPDAAFKSMFRLVTREGVVENQYAREKGTGIYLMMDANASYTRIFYGLAGQRKEKMEIF
jgi:hypothetical protein